jgi:nitroreductase
VDVDEAIRSRRTVKELRPEEVPPDLVRELLALAVLAPNHHLTEPWRFWVLGPETLQRLVEATGDVKLTRSRTAVLVGITGAADEKEAEEDYAAAACAIQNAMLAARARGLASYWRTPGVFARPAFRQTVGVGDDVRLVGLLHLGWPAEEFPEGARRSAEHLTSWRP